MFGNFKFIGEGNFEQQEGRLKGYDFQAFMDEVRSEVRPALESAYEEEKEYKKHVINL